MTNLQEQWWLKTEEFDKAKQVLIGVKVRVKSTGEIGIIFGAFIQPPYKGEDIGSHRDLSPKIYLLVNFPADKPEYCHTVLIQDAIPLPDEEDPALRQIFYLARGS